MQSNKKHVLDFRFGDKELNLGTDDIADVFAQPWFAEFLGVRPAEVRQVAPDRDSYRELAIEQQRQIRALQQQILNMQNMQMAPVPQQPVQQQQPAVQQLPPQPVQQQQPQPQRPQAGLRGRLQSLQSPMDMDPNQMTEQAWNSMAPEQQQAWMQKWGIQA